MFGSVSLTLLMAATIASHFPTDQAFYQLRDVQRSNLDLHVTPAAVTYPESAEQISAIIRCASRSQLKLQAKETGTALDFILPGAGMSKARALPCTDAFNSPRVSFWSLCNYGG